MVSAGLHPYLVMGVLAAHMGDVMVMCVGLAAFTAGPVVSWSGGVELVRRVVAALGPAWGVGFGFALVVGMAYASATFDGAWLATFDGRYLSDLPLWVRAAFIPLPLMWMALGAGAIVEVLRCVTRLSGDGSEGDESR